MDTPAISTPALAAAYWLHMLATVGWIGGLATMAVLVIPAARRSLEAGAYAAFIGQLQERMQMLGWFSLLVLTGTGLFQMSASPNYSGFMAIDNPWAMAILLKHGAILLMVAASAVSTWGVLPQLRRSAMLRAAGKPAAGENEQRLLRQETRLLLLNLLLSVAVLALTAWARVS